MEVGWYLRFCRKDALEVLADADRLAQLEDQHRIVGGWTMDNEIIASGEQKHLRVTYQRKKA